MIHLHHIFGLVPGQNGTYSEMLISNFHNFGRLSIIDVNFDNMFISRFCNDIHEHERQNLLTVTWN